MRLRHINRTLVAGVARLFLLPGMLAGGALVALYQWGAFADSFTLLVAVLAGLAALMGYLVLIAYAVGQSFVRTVRQAQLGTELIATVNPGHRLTIATGDELQRLAEEVNHLADRLEAAREDGMRAAAGATAALDVERARLVRVLDALADGVVVVTLDGRVSLANRGARSLLGENLLGRRLADIVPRGDDLIRGAFESIGAEGGSALPASLQTPSAGVVDVNVAPFRESAERLSGLVLVLRHRAPDWAVDGRSASPRGAGLYSGVADDRARDRRPMFYDFSLLDDVDQRLPSDDRARSLQSLTCTVLDVETTGLDPARGDRIVSVACTRVRNGAVRAGETLDVLVNPARPIPPASRRLHGITDEMVALAPPVSAVLPDILRFAAGTVLVGHHVWFDLKFLRQVTDDLGLPPLTATHPVLDTRMLSTIVHGPLERHDLDTVCGRLGVACPARHSALGDALATAEILVRLVELLGRRGVLTLGDALQAMRRLRGEPSMSA